MSTQEQEWSSQVSVELSGRIANDLVDHAREKISSVLRHTAAPVPRVSVRVTRHNDPARSRPVTARANVDLNGRLVRVEAEAPTPREAVDQLVDRLQCRLDRMGSGWRRRHGHHDAGDVPGLGAVRSRDPGGPDIDEEADRPEIIRHWTVGRSPATVDEAVADMEDLEQDFHLFLERTRNLDSVVYRAGPTGVRLCQLDGHADLVEPGQIPLSYSATPAPVLDTAGAIERLRMTGLPFVFYLDGDHDRACVLYRRADGHYGLVDALKAVEDERR